MGLDFALFLLLVRAGTSPFAANAISGTCAVTFVYFVSVSRIFASRDRFLLRLFVAYLAYLAYQACGVTAASLAVGWLSKHHTSPGFAKILILPVTFTANYLFMLLLTRRGALSSMLRKGQARSPLRVGVDCGV